MSATCARQPAEIELRKSESGPSHRDPAASAQHGVENVIVDPGGGDHRVGSVLNIVQLVDSERPKRLR